MAHKPNGPREDGTHPERSSNPPEATSAPLYDREAIARLCARFVTHLFACPQDAAPSSPVKPTLPHFIAYALHRTNYLHSSIPFAALFLLQRLKARFPNARGSSGHRLFLSALMIASKVMCDDTYSLKSWRIVSQGMFELYEINQMEREFCSYLEWELAMDEEALSDFEFFLKMEFSLNRPEYPQYPGTAGAYAQPGARSAGDSSCEKECGNIYNITNIFYGTVNNVDHVENATFGDTYAGGGPPGSAHSSASGSTPPNAFVTFACGFIKARYSTDSGSAMSADTISDIVTETWRSLTPDEKLKVAEESERAEELHMATLGGEAKGSKGAKMKDKYWSFTSRMIDFWSRKWNLAESDITKHLGTLSATLLGIPLRQQPAAFQDGESLTHAIRAAFAHKSKCTKHGPSKDAELDSNSKAGDSYEPLLFL